MVNNVIRLLESKNIPFTAFETPVEKMGADETAAILNIAVHQVFKTIVVMPERGKTILAVIPGDREVDLKTLAAVIGQKKVHTASQREAEAATGLQTGGISPLALLNKGFQVWLDEAALSLGIIYISGGQRGLIIRMTVESLIEITRAHKATITQKKTFPNP